MSWNAERNIWGEKGCKDPNGNLCTACCIFPGVVLAEEFGTSISKPANTPCFHLSRGGGCSLHGTNRQPEMCVGFHCSNTSREEKLHLIAQHLSTGSVTLDQAVQFARQVSSSDPQFLRRHLEQEAVRIAQRTAYRPLIQLEVDGI